MKPSYFKLKDFLTFGLLSIFSIIGCILFFILVQPIQQAHFLMLLVSLAFVALYVRFIFIRKSELSNFTWIKTKYFGLMVDFGDYKCSKDEIIKETESTTEKWLEYFDSEKGMDEIDVVWVWFKKIPFPAPGQKKVKVAGATIYYTTQMHAGYHEKKDPISKTSFAHELGHILQGHISGTWDEKEHHVRSKEAKLP